MTRCDISRLHCRWSVDDPLSLKLAYLVTLDQAVVQCLTFRAEGCVTLLCPHESGMQIIKVMLKALQPGFARIQNGLSGGARLRHAGLVRRGERVSMYQGVS